MSILQQIQEAANKAIEAKKETVNEARSCSMENEESTPTKPKTKVPMVVNILKDRFPDPSVLTLTKVKNAIKGEFKKEAFSLEKVEWEKMSKEEQTKFAQATLNHLKSAK